MQVRTLTPRLAWVAAVLGVAMTVITPAAHAADGGRRPSTRLVVCDQFGTNLMKEPSSFSVKCASRDVILTRLTWISWKSRVARGHGTLTYSTCQPTCSNGERRSAHATVVLAKPAEQNDAIVFTEVTITYTNAVGNRVTKRYHAQRWKG